MSRISALLIVLFCCLHTLSFGQTKAVDTAPKKKNDTAAIPAPPKPKPYKPGVRDIFHKPDSSKPYSPRIAILRSAIIPGLGQITNKKYWKLPLVYGALGITAGVFFHNVKQFKTARDAYILASDTIASNDILIPEPYYSVRANPERIRTFRNQVRQNVDYSVLFFVLFWGLNVADAAVDAHLKTFDVSDNLAIQFKSGYSPMANTKGVSVVLKFGETAKSKNSKLKIKDLVK